MAKKQDFFTKFANSLPASVSGVAFLLYFLILMIGAVLILEDINSSLLAMRMFEDKFDYTFSSIIIANGFIVAALLPTVVSFLALYAMRLKEYRVYAIIALVVAQSVDIYTDAYYRGQGDIFSSPDRAFMVIIITILLYTVGSEIALTFGVGGVRSLASNGSMHLGELLGSFIVAVARLSEGIRRQVSSIRFHYPTQQGKPKDFDAMLRQAKANEQSARGGGNPANQSKRFRARN